MSSDDEHALTMAAVLIVRNDGTSERYRVFTRGRLERFMFQSINDPTCAQIKIVFDAQSIEMMMLGLLS